MENLLGIVQVWLERDARARQFETLIHRPRGYFAQWRLMFGPVYFLSFVVLANCALVDVKLST